MTISALNPVDPFWFTPDSEEDEENPTRFKIRGLLGDEQSQITPEIIFDAEGRFKSISGEGIRKALKFGLIAWENFSNDKGEMSCKPGNHKFMTHSLRFDLVIAILNASIMGDDDAKKS